MTTLAAAAATAPAAPPTAPAADRLAELEQVIERGLAEFVRVGEALREIRDERLFLATHPSFKAYLADRWRFSDQAAYQRIYAAGVASAIVASGAELPAGISQEALKPMVPLLNREGPEAVASAWQKIVAEHDSDRPPSIGTVRSALQSAGFITSAPPKPKPARFEGIGDRLRTAIKRVEGITAQLNGRPLPPSTRKRVMELASLARELADLLDGLTDTSSATARLRALEPDPPSAPEPELHAEPEPGPESADEPYADLCIAHGSHRDARGHCTLCGRPDLYKPGINGERVLPQAG